MCQLILTTSTFWINSSFTILAVQEERSFSARLRHLHTVDLHPQLLHRILRKMSLQWSSTRYMTVHELACLP